MVNRYRYVDTSILNVTLPSDLWIFNAYKSVHEFVMMPSFKTFPRLPLASCRDFLPSWGGIYFVVSGDGEVLYIGQSETSLRTRHQNHNKRPAFFAHKGTFIYYLDEIMGVRRDYTSTNYANQKLSFICGGVTSNIRLLERFFINMYLPQLNKIPPAWILPDDNELAFKLHEIRKIYPSLVGYNSPTEMVC